MKRDLSRLTERTFDVLIVGGGIYGATLAWEAVSRGLTTALIERLDFGSGTSANSLKVIHGGIRYLQHGDVARLRESSRERSILMRIAPHLVYPLPTLIPTYGYGLQSRAALYAALKLNDVLTIDRNKDLDPDHHIPAGRLVSRSECMTLAPGIEDDGLTGGAVYYDAQVYNPERLVLAFIQSAWAEGAVTMNYVGASGLMLQGDRVTGAHARDELSGDTFPIRAHTTVNAAGPWLGYIGGERAVEPQALAYNVVTRPLFQGMAVGVQGRSIYHDPDVLVARKSRLFFVAPWRERSLIGTGYVPWEGGPDEVRLDERLVHKLLDELNASIPGAQLSTKDVSFVHAGLLPMKSYDRASNSVQVKKHASIVDHRELGRRGLLSVSGVKYTTARSVAVKVIDQVLQALDRGPIRSRTHELPLRGARAVAERRSEANHPIAALHRNYGSNAAAVLEHCVDSEDDLELLRAQARYAVEEEMAVSLNDVVFRRTELGTAGYPGSDVLKLCAETLASILGWSRERMGMEVARTELAYPEWLRPAENSVEGLAR